MTRSQSGTVFGWASSQRSNRRPVPLSRMEGSCIRVLMALARFVIVDWTLSLAGIRRLRVMAFRGFRLLIWLSGTGSRPARRRARTSMIVDGARPTALAIWRSDASGLRVISSPANRRPAAELMGLIRPSLPILAEDSVFAVDLSRIAATVFGD